MACGSQHPDLMALGKDVAIGVWSRCPRAMLRHPMLDAAAIVSDSARISPLWQWPDSYSAGVVECVKALAAEREIAQIEAMREAR